MATTEIGTDRRPRTKLAALVLVIALTITLLAMQAPSWFRTTNPPVRPSSLIVPVELPKGPQHGQGPHPYVSARP
jgi:hypothetical protein